METNVNDFDFLTIEEVRQEMLCGHFVSYKNVRYKYFPQTGNTCVTSSDFDIVVNGLVCPDKAKRGGTVISQSGAFSTLCSGEDYEYQISPIGYPTDTFVKEKGTIKALNGHTFIPIAENWIIEKL